jgi:hypothetical protein
MSYLTVEVEIDHGYVSSKSAEALPEKASGLLTILDPKPEQQLRPFGLARGQFTVPDDFISSSTTTPSATASPTTGSNSVAI